MKNTIQNIKSNIKVVYSDNDTLSIIFNSNELLSGVVGEFNSNIKELENITQTSIYTRGNSISVKGSSKKNELIKNAITFLSEQFLINGSIEKKDVHSSITKFMISENKTKLNKIDYIIKTPKKSVIPRSEKQKNYVRALNEKDIIISAGPAGTGKTFLAVAVAFCASSKIANEFFNVLPLINANGAISISPISILFWIFSKSNKS